MLRGIVGLLIVANAAFFAWSQGYLGGLGLSPAPQNEPQRLAQQVHPDSVRLLNGPHGVAVAEAPVATTPEASAPADVAQPEAAPPAPLPAPLPAVAPSASAAPEPRTCYQAGGFTEAQAELLRAELRLLDLGSDAWQLSEVRSPGRWVVYMGRYDNADQLDRKKAELRALGVEFRELKASGLAPGLALGTFSSEAAARTALQQTERSGVRTARVAQERAESLSFNLRLPAISDTQRQRIEGLRQAMAGKTLQRCS